jgi:hypothetical protein
MRVANRDADLSDPFEALADELRMTIVERLVATDE